MGDQFRAIEAMGAKPAKKDKHDKLLRDDSYVGQVKFDGFRISVEKQCGQVKIFGRGSGKYDSRTEYTDLLPHIADIVRNNEFLPNGTILDGEVGHVDEYGAYDMSKTSNVMGSLPDRAIKIQEERGWLHFNIFDVLSVGNKDMMNMPFHVRNSLAQGIAESIKHPLIHHPDTVRGYSAKKELLDRELENGREGIMLKHLDSIYFPGKKRENTWYKIKAENDADVVILGYTEPDELTQVMSSGKKVVDINGNPVYGINRYHTNGWIGSLVVGQYVRSDKLSKEQEKYVASHMTHPQIVDNYIYHLVPVGRVSSGLADSVRDSISLAKEQNMFKVLEIKYFKRTDDSYYLPRFSRFRDTKDKSVKQCFWED